LILAGDLNFIMSVDEAWGGSGGISCIDDFYKELFQSHNLVDVKPVKLVPTWRNGCAGQEAIERRLDRVFVSEEILSEVGIYRSWVEHPFVSDHAPVFFQMEIRPRYKPFPFKFNSDWLREKEFVDLVHKTWLDPMFRIEDNSQKRLLWKLQVLKNQTKSWIKEFRERKLAKITSLESDIKAFIGQAGRGSY
jgi:hypothetical protein